MYSIVSRNLTVLFPSLYISKLITKIFKLIKLENENIQGKRLAIMVLWVVSQWVVYLSTILESLEAQVKDIIMNIKITSIVQQVSKCFIMFLTCYFAYIR